MRFNSTLCLSIMVTKMTTSQCSWEKTRRKTKRTHTHIFTQKLLKILDVCEAISIFTQSVACACVWGLANENVSVYTLEKGVLKNWQHHSWLNQYLFFYIKADFLPNCLLQKLLFIHHFRPKYVIRQNIVCVLFYLLDGI